MRVYRFLVKGCEIIVDDTDADLFVHHWHLQKGYVKRNIDRHKVFLHRVILERKLGRPVRKDMLSDHENRDKWDNRRENLREISIRDSNLNRRLRD
jgi:hypothetical protein